MFIKFLGYCTKHKAQNLLHKAQSTEPTAQSTKHRTYYTMHNVHSTKPTTRCT